MELWVLQYEMLDCFLYLTPDNQHTTHLKDALKFYTEKSALDHATEHDSKLVLRFTAKLRDFDFLEK